MMARPIFLSSVRYMETTFNDRRAIFEYKWLPSEVSSTTPLALSSENFDLDLTAWHRIDIEQHSRKYVAWNGTTVTIRSAHSKEKGLRYGSLKMNGRGSGVSNKSIRLPFFASVWKYSCTLRLQYTCTTVPRRPRFLG